MPQEHLQWTLARRPGAGLPEPEDFVLRKAGIPEPGPGQMLTRTLYLSMDPYQWGRRRGGLESVGEVCHGRTVSQVVTSRIPEYAAGDFVFNTNGWQEYGLSGEGISVFGYMFPRPDGIVLGGTFERGVWDTTPDPKAIARIVASHKRFFEGFRCTA